MINRVLIRIKVVQMLYSFLLTEKDFMLESQPSAPTKEKRFAYNLYLDMLVLFVQIADEIGHRGNYRPLSDNSFIRLLVADEKIRGLMTRYRSEGFPYSDIIHPLATKVKDSVIYKNYLKSDIRDRVADLKIWRQIFSSIIVPSAEYLSIVSAKDNYSMRGVERMKEMIESTFLNFSTSQGHLSDALKTLRYSLGKARELYFRLLILPVELTDMRMQRIDANLHKLLPTEEDINPNLKFVENRFVEAVRSNPIVNSYLKENPISWVDDDKQFVEMLLTRIMESPIYSDYMSTPVSAEEVRLQEDCELWRNIYKQVIFDDAEFLDVLETKSVFWNDDLEIIGTFLLKTIKRFENYKNTEPVLAMYKDEEDARFGEELFSDTIKGKDEFREYINRFLKKELWDADRLAFMDVVIMITAMAELLNFPKIPIKVTINEYVEIAKSYSTSKSGAFINGLMASIVTSFKEEHRLQKD